MINFVGNKKIFIAISLVLMIASIASLLIQGFNLDTDFAGGMAVTYQIDAECEVKDIDAIVSKALGANKKASSVQKSGTGEVIIKFGYDNALKDDAERAEYAAKNIDAITKALTEEYTNVSVINRDVVSPSTGKELARSAVWMSIFAALAILIYITIRFEFISGVCAVLCLVHDVSFAVSTQSQDLQLTQTLSPQFSPFSVTQSTQQSLYLTVFVKTPVTLKSRHMAKSQTQVSIRHLPVQSMQP